MKALLFLYWKINYFAVIFKIISSEVWLFNLLRTWVSEIIPRVIFS
jgi:hypothetical protein